MIKAFDRKVSREKACQIIINDYICCICYARNTEVLECLLLDGWKALNEWSDQELEDYIAGLCIENQKWKDLIFSGV